MVVEGCRCHGILSLILAMSLLFHSGCVSTLTGGHDAGINQKHAVTVQGKVQSISLEEGIMVLSLPQGDRLTLKITGQTLVDGGTLKDITRFHPVKARYTGESGHNYVLFLEILPQGSCSGN